LLRLLKAVSPRRVGMRPHNKKKARVTTSQVLIWIIPGV